MEFLRFFTVSATGVLVDVGIGWLLASALGAPLWLAAASGFAVAAALNYVLHRRWTFQHAGGMAEHTRLLRYLGALGLTFVARMAAVSGLSALLGPEVQPLAVLVPSVAISFAVSFLATKFMVFRGGENGDAE
jgi:putative flippase GtrA